MVENPDHFDPAGELATRNKAKFDRKCQRATATFLQAFYSRLPASYEALPPAARAVLFYVRREVALRFPRCEEQALRALFFLRFVQPAVCDPAG